MQQAAVFQQQVMAPAGAFLPPQAVTAAAAAAGGNMVPTYINGQLVMLPPGVVQMPGQGPIPPEAFPAFDPAMLAAMAANGGAAGSVGMASDLSCLIPGAMHRAVAACLAQNVQGVVQGSGYALGDPPGGYQGNYPVFYAYPNLPPEDEHEHAITQIHVGTGHSPRDAARLAAGVSDRLQYTNRQKAKRLLGPMNKFRVSCERLPGCVRIEMR